MARRGLLAELNHQMQVAAANRSDGHGKPSEQRSARYRQPEQARKAEERAAAQLARASAADQKRLAKEAREAHVAAMEAEVERRNLELAQMYEEIDSLLSATLGRRRLRGPGRTAHGCGTPAVRPGRPRDPGPATPARFLIHPSRSSRRPFRPKASRAVGGKKHEKAVADAAAAHESRSRSMESALVEAESPASQSTLAR